LTIRFSGPDERTVIERANSFWEKHVAKRWAATAVKTPEESFISDVPKVGRGKASTGKTWLLNRATGERARVFDSEVDAYLAKGFIKAGPRSK
jgi:hypothetical protein